MALYCRVIWLAVLLAFSAGASAAPASTNWLVWHKDKDSIDADVHTWQLPQVLQCISIATGWRIFVEPGVTRNVSVAFKDLPRREALETLFGNLNFAFFPKTNGPSQLYVFKTALGQATRLVKAPRKKIDSSKPIANELVVTLKKGSKVNIEELAKSLGAKVVGKMDGENAYRLEFDDAAAAEAARESLLDNPDVERIDSNFPIDPTPTYDLSNGGASPDLDLKPKSNDGNCQLVIGLIDTSVQSLGKNLDAFMQPSIHVAGEVQDDPSQINHGTAMAEAMLQMLNNRTGGNTSVKIQPVDVYGANEMTTTFDVANGIVQAVNNGANLINLSLGTSGDSQFLHSTIKKVSAMGIPIYAAAGNEPVTTPTYPAAYQEVVAVTASDKTGNIADYANRGSFVDIIAPGDDVVNFGGQRYFVQGTSTATAFITGTAAGLADSAGVCADQAQTLLTSKLKPTAK